MSGMEVGSRMPFRFYGASPRSESAQHKGNRLSERIRKHAPIEKKLSFEVCNGIIDNLI